MQTTNSSKMILAAICFFIIGASRPAQAAGGMEGGGGKAVVCRDEKHQIKSVQLLDLWEAENIWGDDPVWPRKIAYSEASVERQLNDNISRLSFATLFIDGIPDNGLDYVLSPVALGFLPGQTQVEEIKREHGDDLVLTDDSFEEMVPAAGSGCKIEQVVTYYDEGPHGPFVLVNQDIVDKMDKTNEAALYLHEAFYSYLRSEGETNSIRVRRAIGYVFSGYTFQKITSVMAPRHIACYQLDAPVKGVTSALYISNSADGSLGITPSKYHGVPTVGFFPNFDSHDHATIDEVLAYKKVCSWDPHQYWTGQKIGGVGPVDFDRILYFGYACRDGQLKYYVSQDINIANTPEDFQKLTELNCTLIEDKKPSPTGSTR